MRQQWSKNAIARAVDDNHAWWARWISLIIIVADGAQAMPRREYKNYKTISIKYLFIFISQ